MEELIIKDDDNQIIKVKSVNGAIIVYSIDDNDFTCLDKHQARKLGEWLIKQSKDV